MAAFSRRYGGVGTNCADLWYLDTGGPKGGQNQLEAGPSGPPLPPHMSGPIVNPLVPLRNYHYCGLGEIASFDFFFFLVCGKFLLLLLLGVGDVVILI